MKNKQPKYEICKNCHGDETHFRRMGMKRCTMCDGLGWVKTVNKFFDDVFEKVRKK